MDLVRTKIAVRRSRTADMNRLVRHRDMRRAGIGIGIDRNCGDPHALGSPHDPAGDFATVGNQDFLEHETFPVSRCFWVTFGSERQIVVLARRVLELLVGQHRKRPRDPPARISRHDYVVKVAAPGGNERVGEFLAILVGLGD